MQNGQVHPEINQGAKETSVYTQGKDRNELWYLWIGVEGTEAEDGDAVAWLVNSLPCSAARLTQNITKCASHLPVRHSYPSRTLWPCPTVLLASWRKPSLSHMGGQPLSSGSHYSHYIPYPKIQGRKEAL